MTVSSTRCCRRADLLGALRGASGSALARRALGAHAQGIDVKRPTVTIAEDHFVLEAQFDIALTPTLEEVLNKGVPLYFLLEFELIRPRWYWFNERVVAVPAGVPPVVQRAHAPVPARRGQPAPELRDARRSARSDEPRAPPQSTSSPARCGATRPTSPAMRFRLDTSQLPKPFQLNALVAREWNVDSDWYRWTVTP